MKKTLAIALVLTCVVVVAQERFDIKVREYFFSGFSGDEAALDKGLKICEEELVQNPKNAEAMVWHGSGVYFRSFAAFQSGDMEKGMALSRRGMEEMDKAVALGPENVGVRVPRGAMLLTASHFVPDPQTSRSMVEKGVTDFEHIYEMQKGHFDHLGKHPRGELMLGMADGYARLGQSDKAEQWFNRIRTELKGTRYEDSANQWFQTKSPLPAKQAGCLGCHTGS